MFQACKEYCKLKMEPERKWSLKCHLEALREVIEEEMAPRETPIPFSGQVLLGFLQTQEFCQRVCGMTGRTSVASATKKAL